MTDTKDLQKQYEAAEAKAFKIQADKDEALQAVRDKYRDKLREATDEAAAIQKEWRDAMAADGLVGRPEGETLATALGLELPED